MNQIARFTAALLASASPLLAQTSAVLKSEFIYESAPFSSCHASTIAEAQGGGLVAAWFGGTAEGRSDVGIWVSRNVDAKWSPPVEVATGLQTDGKRHPCWNPVLFQPKAGPLLLFYKVGPTPGTWWGMVRESTDGGATWGDARRLPAGILGPVKNKPVQLPDGMILSGSSSEHDGWRVHFERSADNGRSWTLIGPVNDGKDISAIQPSILLHTDGRLQALGRTRQGKVFDVWSADSGASWGKMRLLDVPNPNSGTDALTLRDGRHLLVHNPVSKGRTPLVVSVSKDGRTWDPKITLESAPGEYSYPAIIQTPDGLIHITHTWKRQRIQHTVLDPAKI